MNKTELLHLHSLLVTVADDLRDDGTLALADLEPYFELEITPVAVQGARADHERAVWLLATILSDAVSEQSPNHAELPSD
ncbi:UPF0058 family protein [Halobium palmae]|uniref:UPF0058 family protein n=1 Tax=Halobium palmae TaxID=1776492 RepID=A0ABD5S3Q7_9EURY